MNQRIVRCKENVMSIKRLGLPGLMLLCTLWTMFSCRKESVSVNPASADSTALFSATIGGTSWQTDSVSAFLVSEVHNGVKIMTITGYTSNRVITISLKDTSTANDSTLTAQLYPADSNSRGNASAFVYGYDKIWVGRNLVWKQEGSSISGEATVSSSDGVNKKITGTFSFVAQALDIDSTGLVLDTVNVSGGVFKNISYSYLRHP